MNHNLNRSRQFIVFFFFCLLFIAIIMRLLYIQVFENKRFLKKANTQHKVVIELKPRRGTIYDSKNRILALDTAVNSVFAVSKEIEDKEAVGEALSRILKLDKKFVMNRLNRKKAFVWIKRKVTDEEALDIKEAQLDGVALLKETKRSYPNDSLGAHIVGLTDMDNSGIGGVELVCDTDLKGKYGWKKSYRDAKRNLISSYEEYLPESPGYNVVLNIDEVVQSFIEDEIKNIVESYNPRGVMIVAMAPATGEIVGMGSYPGYNPNDARKADPEAFKNKCLVDTFEPGSVFKMVTASAVLEEKALSPEDVIYCENGEYHVGRRILHDYHPYGKLSFREVIEKSSNIGTVKAASRIGQDKMYEYVKRFGFGSKTGFDLPGEDDGILRHKSTWTPSDMTTIPMGQGISCTALQLVTAMSVIANGGVLMKPYVIKCVIDDEGNMIKTFSPQSVRRVISPNTAATVREFLEGVVERGTGTKAKMDNYSAGGKTGTAQKVGEGGRYAEGKYVGSFVGFAPVVNPRIALAVCIDEPKGAHFGGVVSAPSFKNIMLKTLKYLEVPESQKKVKKNAAKKI